MFALLIVVILCTGLGIHSISAIALTRTVGVHVGDSAEYSVFAQGNATGLNLTNIPTHARFTVTGINGTNVTLESYLTFSNNTQKTQGGTLDIDTGNGNMTVWLIAPNLNQGDLIYNTTSMSTFTGARINGTITRNYLGSNVEVNHLNLTHSASSSGNSSKSWNCFWFRDSGWLAETTINATSVQGGTTEWVFEHIMITGTIPEFPVNMILPLFVFFSTFAVVTARKKLVKPAQ